MSVVLWKKCVRPDNKTLSSLSLTTFSFLIYTHSIIHLLTFPTYSGSVPVYSSTTKNWFQTHPLFTRSSDEGPCSGLLPPEVEPLVLEASHQPKLQQIRRHSAANSVRAPTVQKGAIFDSKEKEERNPAGGLHVI